MNDHDPHEWKTLYESGLTITHIAARASVASSRVYQALLQLGVSMRRGRRISWAAFDQDAAVKEYESCLSIANIAKKFGVHQSSIRHAIHKYGAKAPKPQLVPLSANRLRARAMKRDGLTYDQIADRLHVSRQRAHQLVGPSSHEKQQMVDNTRGKCQGSGKPSVEMHAHHENYDSGQPQKLLCPSCHKSADVETTYTLTVSLKANQMRQLNRLMEQLHFDQQEAIEFLVANLAEPCSMLRADHLEIVTGAGR